jgi:multiple sugar transport system substrate-binding protein
MRYKALTWDHPRGYRALRDAAAEVALEQGLSIAWEKQPLEGFESHPVADLCARYDLIVLDHPHVGEAVEAGCLLPLEDVFGAAELAELGAATIGPCLSSYRYAGRLWALPLDAATQVMAYRPDLTAPMQSWDEVEALVGQGGVALSLAGPHAILSFLSIATALGDPPATRDPAQLVDDETGAQVFGLMARIYAHSDRSTLALNPIGILGHMAMHDDVRVVPLVYGYVNYTRERVRFANAPRGPGGIGSTLGGTGIGISTRCQITPALLTHLRWLLGQLHPRPRWPAQPPLGLARCRGQRRLGRLLRCDCRDA